MDKIYIMENGLNTQDEANIQLGKNINFYKGKNYCFLIPIKNK